MFKTARAEGTSILFRGLGACIGRQIRLYAAHVRFVIMGTAPQPLTAKRTGHVVGALAAS